MLGRPRGGSRPTPDRPRRGSATARPRATPPRIDVGLTQLFHGSPASPPAGTRPDAIAPDHRAHAIRHEHRRRGERRAEVPPVSACVSTALRNAKPDPRRTMPSAASVSGTKSVSVIDAYASGKHGPEHDEDEDQPDVVRLPDRADRVVDELPRSRAALGPAGDEIPEPGAEVGAAEQRVGDHADEQDDRAAPPCSWTDRLRLRRRLGPSARTARRLVEVRRPRRNRRLIAAQARGSIVTPSAT